jgi:hypothetical protein
VRFNDYHKQICAALKLDEENQRHWRPFMLRCYSRKLLANACLALVRIEIERLAAAAKPTPAAPGPEVA